jgi:DNA-directed RNA polymerase specialized sigma24 family protein
MLRRPSSISSWALWPEHSEVIDLVYYHRKSVKEVAEIVGGGEATVKTRMFYARSKLASLVATGSRQERVAGTPPRRSPLAGG